jgi:hypothetical protein
MTNWIDVSTASRKTNVSDRTIRNWITKGKLIAKKEKGVWLIDESSLQEKGNQFSELNGKAEPGNLISVPLQRYEALITRLAQLENENSQYRKMLEAHEPLWKRIFHRKTKE